MTTPRRTEEVASGVVNESLMSIRMLTAGQPTTSELEEAQRHVLALQRSLRDWISARHLTECHKAGEQTFLERHPEMAAQTLTPAEEAAFDELEARAIERAHPSAGGLHHIFETITDPMRRPA